MDAAAKFVDDEGSNSKEAGEAGENAAQIPKTKMVWQCSVCKKQTFANNVARLAHEEQCPGKVRLTLTLAKVSRAPVAAENNNMSGASDSSAEGAEAVDLTADDDAAPKDPIDVIGGLKSLNLGRHSKSIYFPHGWGALFDYLQKPTCVLEDLDMSLGCSFTDEESANLFDALKNNSSLKSLNLASCLRQATRRTWSSVSAMLESETTVLEKLNLCYSPVNNDALYAFSCNLAVNNKMKELLLYNDPDWQTEWKAYSRVLCNTTSIQRTFDSNHTLQRVVNNRRQPKGIAALLEMNQGKNAFDVARQKIIDVHFRDGYVGMEPFVDMEANVLPRALAWMARGGKRGQVEGHFYEFLKSVPTLFGGSSGSSSAKRKRED